MGLKDEQTSAHDRGNHDKVEKPTLLMRCVRIVQGRWVRMIVFTAAVFFTTALYYGWQQYQLMIYKSGAYSWLCTDADLDEDGLCKAQQDAVAVLYSVAAGCEYASAALGGALLDHIGPRRTGFLGEVMFAIGTLMLAFSSEKVPLYIPAMIVIGTSVNVTSFPSLCTVETFPKWHGLMVGLMLAASQAATGIPPVLYALMQKHADWSFRGIWLCYLAAIWLPIFVLYIIALPGARDFNKMLKLQRRQMMDNQAEQKEGDDVALMKTTSESSVEIVQRKASWTEFLHSVTNIDMGVMAACFFMLNVCVSLDTTPSETIMLPQYAYYPTVVRQAISPEISNFLAYAMPTQAVWALAVGVICDYYSTVAVMAVMSTLLCVVFIFCLAPHVLWLQYLGASILVCSQSALFEVKFTYVQEMFDPYNYGKLVGLLGVVGGLGTFVNIGMSGVADFTRVFIAYICVVAVELVLVGYLGYRQRVQKVSYKTLPETEADRNSPLALPEHV